MLKMLKKIVIKRVTIKGFKSYQDEMVFNLYTNTFIKGRNRQGKTSILDAIVWAFLGCSYSGSEQDNKLINDQSAVAQVQVDFDSDDGSHTLIRKKAVSGQLQIKFDGMPLTSKHMDELIYSKEVFLSILNPTYFVSLAADNPKKAREIIVALIADVPKEEIFNCLSLTHVELLKDKNISDINLFLKGKRDELQTLEENRVFTEGEINGIGVVDETKVWTHEDESEYTRLSKLSENSELNNLLKTKSELQDKMNKLKMAKHPDEPKLQQLKNQMVLIKKEHTATKQSIGTLVAGSKCPSCRQEISERHVSFIKNEVHSKLKLIVAKAQPIATESAEIEKAIAEYEKTKGIELAELQIQIDNCNKKIENYSRTNNDGLLQLKNLIKKKNDCAIEVKKKEKLQKSQSMLQKIDTEKISVNEIICAATAYSNKKAELNIVKVQSLLSKTTLQLIDIVKTTGEIKDVFKLQYDRRDYTLLCESDRIRIGLEIGSLFKTVMDVEYPLLLDSADSILEFDPKREQVIQVNVRPCALKVLNGDVKKRIKLFNFERKTA